jgi:hypothetical protein
MPARTGLWEPRAGNGPGPPGHWQLNRNQCRFVLGHIRGPSQNAEIYLCAISSTALFEGSNSSRWGRPLQVGTVGWAQRPMHPANVDDLPLHCSHTGGLKSEVFWKDARTSRLSDTLIDGKRNFCPAVGYNSAEVTQMMHSRPSFIRLSLAELPCSETFAQRANGQLGYAPASEKNRRK